MAGPQRGAPLTVVAIREEAKSPPTVGGGCNGTTGQRRDREKMEEVEKDGHYKVGSAIF